MKKMQMLMIGASLSITQPLQAACWNDKQMEAVKLRHLDVMLMVTALRCRTSDHNFLSYYNRFVESERIILSQSNKIIRNHYYARMNRKSALNAYDSLIISMANQYGSGHQQYSCKALDIFMQQLANQKNDRVSLLKHSEEMTMKFKFPEKICTIRIANAKK